MRTLLLLKHYKKIQRSLRSNKETSLRSNNVALKINGRPKSDGQKVPKHAGQNSGRTSRRLYVYRSARWPSELSSSRPCSYAVIQSPIFSRHYSRSVPQTRASGSIGARSEEPQSSAARPGNLRRRRRRRREGNSAFVNNIRSDLLRANKEFDRNTVHDDNNNLILLLKLSHRFKHDESNWTLWHKLLFDNHSLAR